ncbi:MAG: hypothetical protein LBJ48_07335, partial [Coriobacteriales bacterium]|nr:hypothetical protein [Coriobacteriales bacterium]
MSTYVKPGGNVSLKQHGTFHERSGRGVHKKQGRPLAKRIVALVCAFTLAFSTLIPSTAAFAIDPDGQDGTATEQSQQSLPQEQSSAPDGVGAPEDDLLALPGEDDVSIPPGENEPPVPETEALATLAESVSLLAGDVWAGDVDVSWYNTTATSFTISTAEQLAGLAAITTVKHGESSDAGNPDSNATDALGTPIKLDNFVGKTVKLTADLDLNGSAENLWYPISDVNIRTSSSGTFNAVGWRGTFDGNGHVVSNMVVDGGSVNYGGYQGLFSGIGAGGVIKNLGLDSPQLHGRVVGGIAAVSSGVTSEGTPVEQWPLITGCSVSNPTITGNGSGSRPSGGIFGGENNDGGRRTASVVNCYVVGGSVTNNQAAGGVAAFTEGYVAGCYSTSQVSASQDYVGAVAAGVLQSRYTNNLGLANSCTNLYRHAANVAGLTGPTVVTTGFSTAVDLRSAAAVATLGSAYVVAPDNTVNNGYPILFWQADLSGGAVPPETSIESATLSQPADQLFTGSPLEPAVTVTLPDTTLVKGRDYLLLYENNTAVGTASITAKGFGRYTGQSTVTFNITQLDLGDASIAPVGPLWFYGEPVTPALTVKDTWGNTLTADVDYVVSYEDNDGAGEATATISPVEGSVSTIGSNSVDFILVAASSSLTGTGVEADPYLLGTKGDIQFLSHALDSNLAPAEGSAAYSTAFYQVTANIDATAADADDLAADPIGQNWSELVGTATVYHRSYFAGTFDGNGKTITVDIKRDERNISAARGLFGYVGIYSTGNASAAVPVVIKNLTVAGTGWGFTYGGIVGQATYAKLVMENCVNTSDIISSSTSNNGQPYTSTAGGLIGSLSSHAYLTLEDSSNTGELQYYSYGGGLIGSSSVYAAEPDLTITDCFNTGDLVVSSPYGSGSGGLIGYLNVGMPVNIQRSFNTGDINGGTDADQNLLSAGGPVGGLIGVAYPDNVYEKPSPVLLIDACYNAGSLYGRGYVGGIVGDNGSGFNFSVGNVYNTGDLRGTGAAENFVGGVVGRFFLHVENWPYEWWEDIEDLPVHYASSLAGYTSGAILLDNAPVERAYVDPVVGYIQWPSPVTLDLNVSYIEDNISAWDEEGQSYDVIAAKRFVATNSLYNVTDISPELADASALKAATATLGASFKDDDSSPINSGFPILYWQGSAGTTSPSLIDLETASAATDAIPNQTYTGRPLAPAVTVKISGTPLVAGADYFISATENNIGVGTAKLTIQGKGMYTGTIEASFNIVANVVSTVTIADIPDQWTYAGEGDVPAQPTLSVVNSAGLRMTLNTDYTVAYANNTVTGTATATITGLGSYTGTASKTFYVTAAATELDGAGTTDDPYLIDDEYDLQLMAHRVFRQAGAYPYAAYQLTTDIDATGVAASHKPAVDTIGAVPGSPSSTSILFQGSFDGDGYTITVERALFGYVANVEIANLTLEGTITANNTDYASFVRKVQQGTISMTNCINKVDVTVTNSNNLGGLVGNINSYTSPYYCDTATFVDCVNRGALSGYGYVGGIVGYSRARNLSFTRCSNEGALSLAASNAYGGGMVANAGGSAATNLSTLTVNSCYNTGAVNGAYYLGGLAGYLTNLSTATISNTFNRGAVTPSSTSTTVPYSAGGIIGVVYGGVQTVKLSNVYNTGAVTGGAVTKGLFIGCQYDTTGQVSITNSYYQSDLTEPVIGANRGEEINGTAESRTATQFKATNASGVAASLGLAFAADFAGVAAVNAGYPILAQQKIDISGGIIANIKSQAYTGAELTPALNVLAPNSITPLRAGTDYNVVYANNVGRGKATVTVYGRGAYQGTLSASFSIVQADLSQTTLAEIPSQTPTGSALTPELTITNAAGNVLVAGVDYTAFYESNIAIGTANVAVYGLGNYTGTLTGSFSIAPAALPLTEAQITLPASYFYTGSAISAMPTSVVLDGTLLTPLADYTLSYSYNQGTADVPDWHATATVNAKGSYMVTVTGVGNYIGTASKDFIVKPFLTVYKSVDGASREFVKEYTQAQFAAVKDLQLSTDPVSALYYGTSWSVSTAKEYVELSQLMQDAGLASYYNDAASVSYGDAGYTRTLNYSVLEGGNFYPATTATAENLAGAYPVKAVLSLSDFSTAIYGVSASATALDAETYN